MRLIGFRLNNSLARLLFFRARSISFGAQGSLDQLFDSGLVSDGDHFCLGDVSESTGRDSETNVLARHVENWHEGGKEGVTQAHRVRSNIQISIKLLNENVTVMAGTVHRISQEVLHRDGIVVVAKLDDKVVWHIHLRALSVSPKAEFVVLPSITLHLIC